jgi:intein-encoded DNA endonuclease-like protein
MRSFYYKNSKETIETIKVEPLEDYCLRTYFSNGEIRIFNVKPYLEYKIYFPLKDKSFFASVKANYGTAFWDYGRGKDYAYGIDIDPKELYWNGVPDNEEIYT